MSKLVLNWDDHLLNSTLTLRNMWEEEEFFDVTLACDDDQIGAHKVILASASPFLRNILKKNPHSHPLLYIKGATKKNMKVLLNFIYSGETHVSQDDLEDFMTLAKSLEVKGLAADALDIEHFNKKLRDAELADIPMNPIDCKRILKGKDKKEANLTNNGTQNEQPLVSSMMIDTSRETQDSPSIEDMSNRATREYDQKLSDLMAKSESCWKCKNCEYISKKRNHLEEHVQIHIKGYTFDCNTCKRLFNSRVSLRHHTRKCRVSTFENILSTESIDPKIDVATL